MRKNESSLSGFLLPVLTAVVQEGEKEFSEIARFIFDYAREATGAVSGYVALLSRDGQFNEVLFLEPGGLECAVDPDLPMPVRGLRAEAYKSGKPVFDNNFSKSKWMKFMPEGHVGLKNVLFAPMIFNDKTVGLIGLANKPRNFTKEDSEIVAVLAQVAAVALYSINKKDELEKNRKFFREVTDNAPLAILNADRNLKANYINRKFAEYFECCLEDLEDLPKWLNSTFTNFSVNGSKSAQEIIKRFKKYCGSKVLESTRADGSRIEVIPYLHSINEESSFISFMDVHPWKEAERKYRKSEHNHNLFIENQSDLVVKFTSDLQLELVSPSYCQFFGLKEKDLIGKPFLPLIHEDDRERIKASLEHVFKPPYTTYHEERVITPDGEKYLGWRSSAVLNSKGEIKHLLGIGRDITSQKEAELALIENNELLDSFFNLSMDGFFFMMLDEPVEWNEKTDKEKTLDWVLDHHRMTRVNRAMAEQYGISEDELLGLTVRQLYGHDLDEARRVWREFFDTGHLQTITHEQKADGTPMTIQGDYACLYDDEGRIIGHFGVQRDITERLAYEQNLKREKDLVSKLAETSPVGILQVTPDEAFAFANYRAEEIFEISRITEKMSNRIQPELHVADMAGNKVERKDLPNRIVERTGEAVRGLRYYIEWPDGRKKAVQVNASPLFDVDGTFEGAIITFEEITQQIENENRIKKLAEITESAQWGVAAFEADTLKIEFLNPALAMMLGYRVEELTEKSFKDVIAGMEMEDFRMNMEILSSERTHEFELTLRRKNGGEFPARLNLSSLSGEDKQNLMIAHIEDLTDVKQAEAQLLRTRNLESIGMLAGGIAHDFNNILTTIYGNIQLARIQSMADPLCVELLGEAEKAVMQAKGLSNQLLTFSQGGAPVKQASSVPELVKESAGFILSGSMIECHYTIEDDLPIAEIDKNQMSQVISNIIINAKQAMPDGGRIRIAIKKEHVPLNKIPYLAEGDYIKIRIKDNGPGIPKENLDRIFDPYFSTRPTGTGLGLSIAFSIMKKHKGALLVNSKEAKGTTFYIYVPVTLEQPESEAEGEEVLVSGGGDVLLMDDDEEVRKTLSKMLNYLGFNVTEVSHGEGVLRSINEGCDYKLIFLDLTIKGGMGGKATLEKLREMDIESKIIIISGYTNDPDMDDYSELGADAALAKPISVDSLSRALERVLDKK